MIKKNTRRAKMERKLSMVLLTAFATVALLESSVSAATYFVGDSSNWAIPSSPNTYSNWASSKNFVIGDILVFNFMQGQHDVSEVTKSAYDACNGANPISRQNSGPANVTLRSAGTHYYICSVPGHCGSGQKLAVSVGSGAPAPAPQPGNNSPSLSPSSSPSPEITSSPLSSPSPSPFSSPAPAPGRGPVTYTVGDTLGWNILPRGAAAYQAWASGKNFKVGDILVFNFANGTHDVAELTKASFRSCNTNSTISVESNPPVRVTLASAGEHFFTCTVPGHCNAGQKIAVNVTGDGGGAPSPSPFADSPSPSAGAPAPSTAADSPTSATPAPTSTGATAPPTSTAADSPTTTSDLPPPSGATSVGAAGYIATLLSFGIIALWL